MMNLRHNRGVLVAMTVAGLLVSLASTGAAADTTKNTACSTVPLPVPAGTVSTVNGGDLTGRYLVGYVQTPDFRRVGALWVGGRYTEIDESSIQHVQVFYHDVNRHGVVAGERMTDTSFHTDAFTYRDGEFTILPPLRPDDSTQALGINSRGDVVGNSISDIGFGWRPVVWPADRPGTVRELPMPAGHSGNGLATGIDEDGSVVGHLSPYPPGTPYLWPAKGKPRALPVPAGSLGGSTAAIQGGKIAGNVYDPATNATVPTLWNLRTGGFTMHKDVRAGALSVNRIGTIGIGGALVHADGRVVSVGAGAAVNTVADTGVAAGTTAEFTGQAVRWVGC